MQSFTQCNKYLQEQAKLAKANGNSDFDYVPSGEATDIGLRVISFFESKYTCSGICNPGLFYFSLTLDKGVPTQGCIQFLK